MKANPDKFQALSIDKTSMDKHIVLDLAGNKIKCEKEVKLLILLMPNCLFLNVQLLNQYYHLHVRECCRLHSYKVCCL
jgi:hypothetical protein